MNSMAPTFANWLDLFLHFASLSLLAVGGAKASNSRIASPVFLTALISRT